MSKSEVKVAKKYAKALFESCHAENYEQVNSTLHEISLSLQDQTLRAALLNPSLSLEQRSAWLSDLCASLCPAEAESLSNLFAVMIKNGRMDGLSSLAEFFTQLLSNYKKLMALEVTSAKELSCAEREELSSKFRATLPSELAKGISFEWKTQAELLGGLQVRVGDKLLDGSVEGAINKIARQLKA